MTIKFGVTCGGDHWSDDDIRAVEEHGYDSFWTGEHIVYHRPILESTTILTHAAALTSRIKIGPATLILPLRHPTIVAKEYSCLDVLSGGALGLAIASALILVLAQLAVVILRYAFGLSFTWLSEIVIYAFAAMFMLGSAAALRDAAHVRVDILRPRFGEAGRNWIELVGTYLFLFPICLRLTGKLPPAATPIEGETGGGHDGV